MEQRRGRLVRQGNTNTTVHLYRYVTQDTFDAYLSSNLTKRIPRELLLSGYSLVCQHEHTVIRGYIYYTPHTYYCQVVSVNSPMANL